MQSKKRKRTIPDEGEYALEEEFDAESSDEEMRNPTERRTIRRSSRLVEKQSQSQMTDVDEPQWEEDFNDQ